MPRPTRTNTTILLVCEGYAEVEFTRVVRDIYLPRGCGTSLRPENRRGYGGAAALELAIQRRAEGAYDRYGLLIDTDQHWSDEHRQRAKTNGICVVECTPCLEAVLLSVGNQKTYPATRDNKAAFDRVYGGPPNRPGLIARHFTRQVFDDARQRVTTIDQILTFVGIEEPE
jgi:hypothetical protein